MRLTLDIETIPAAVASADVDPKWSFDGAMGLVACIGYAEDDEEPHSILLPTEKETLGVFVTRFAKEPVGTVIGHNVSWDLRFLWKRCVVNRLRMPDSLMKCVRAKPWDACLADTMTLWDPGSKTSLDKLCKALGIASPKDDGMDGSKVWEAWQKGEFDRIAKYCRRDVSQVRECWKRLV